MNRGHRSRGALPPAGVSTAKFAAGARVAGALTLAMLAAGARVAGAAMTAKFAAGARVAGALTLSMLAAAVMLAAPAGAIPAEAPAGRDSEAPRARAAIDTLVDRWHRAAATADEGVFFASMTEDAIYLGTDASERWVKPEFERWSKKYFERDTAWNFRPRDRRVYFSHNGDTAWWEEHLDTWMGVCGGSGVAVQTGAGWRIAHYHLAVTIPNAKIHELIAITKNPADTEGTPEYEVMQTVRTLFAAITADNPAMAGRVFDDGAQIVRNTADGGTVSTESFSASRFVETLAAPRKVQWKEKAWSYRVLVDGPMATAWVRYGFYVDGELSHCGVDAFHLVRRGDGWKVSWLGYTRNTDGCEDPGAQQ